MDNRDISEADKLNYSKDNERDIELMLSLSLSLSLSHFFNIYALLSVQWAENKFLLLLILILYERFTQGMPCLIIALSIV